MAYVVAYVVTLVVYAALDLVWVRGLVRRLWERHVPHALLEVPRVGPPMAFAIFYAAVLVYLAAGPGMLLDAVESPLVAGWLVAAVNGAILGLMAHGTREISNLAALTGWRGSMVAAGVLWGAGASAAAALAGYLAARAWVA